MIVLIDNYDSFTFNLVHYLGGLGADVVVHRNDKISPAEVMALEPRKSRVRTVSEVRISSASVNRDRPPRRERAIRLPQGLSVAVRREQHALQRVELLQRLSRTDRYRVQRIMSDHDRHTRLVL